MGILESLNAYDKLRQEEKEHATHRNADKIEKRKHNITSYNNIRSTVILPTMNKIITQFKKPYSCKKLSQEAVKTFINSDLADGYFVHIDFYRYSVYFVGHEDNDHIEIHISLQGGNLPLISTHPFDAITPRFIDEKVEEGFSRSRELFPVVPK